MAERDQESGVDFSCAFCFKAFRSFADLARHELKSLNPKDTREPYSNLEESEVDASDEYRNEAQFQRPMLGRADAVCPYHDSCRWSELYKDYAQTIPLHPASTDNRSMKVLRSIFDFEFMCHQLERSKAGQPSNLLPCVCGLTFPSPTFVVW